MIEASTQATFWYTEKVGVSCMSKRVNITGININTSLDIIEKGSKN
jgi:hypothetical protein